MFRSGCVNILICNLSHHLSSLILLLFPPFTHISSMWWYLLHRFSSGLPFCLTFQSYPPCVLSCCICLLFSITACRQHQKHQAQWRRTFQDHWLTHSESTRTHTHTQALFPSVKCTIRLCVESGSGILSEMIPSVIVKYDNVSTEMKADTNV